MGLRDADYVDRAELAEEVREWIRRGRVVGEELTSIEIEHDGSDDPVKMFPTGEIPKWDEADGDKASELIEAIAKALERDARHLDGVQRYFVLAYHAKSKRATGRIPFELHIEKEGKKRKNGPTYGTDEQSTNALLARLVEKGFGQLGHWTNQSLDRAQKDLRERDQENANLRHELALIRVKFDEMQTQAEARKLQAEESKERREMLREIYKDLKMLAPTIVNRIANEKVLPEAELAPEQIVLRELVRTLDGEEVGMLLDGIAMKHPRAALMLCELFKGVQTEDVRRLQIREELEKRLLAEKQKMEKDKAEAEAASKLPTGPDRPILSQRVA